MSTTVETTTTTIRPFQADIPVEALAELRRRIAEARWSEKELVTDPTQGVQLAVLHGARRTRFRRRRPSGTAFRPEAKRRSADARTQLEFLLTLLVSARRLVCVRACARGSDPASTATSVARSGDTHARAREGDLNDWRGHGCCDDVRDDPNGFWSSVEEGRIFGVRHSRPNPRWWRVPQT